MNTRFSALFTGLALAASALAQSPLTNGNLVVVRVGTGAAALSGSTQAVFVDEYTAAGALVQSIALPVARSGAAGARTRAGPARVEGQITSLLHNRRLRRNERGESWVQWKDEY